MSQIKQIISITFLVILVLVFSRATDSIFAVSGVGDFLRTVAIIGGIIVATSFAVTRLLRKII